MTTCQFGKFIWLWYFSTPIATYKPAFPHITPYNSICSTKLAVRAFIHRSPITSHRQLMCNFFFPLGIFLGKEEVQQEARKTWDDSQWITTMSAPSFLEKKNCKLSWKHPNSLDFPSLALRKQSLTLRSQTWKAEAQAKSSQFFLTIARLPGKNPDGPCVRVYCQIAPQSRSGTPLQ